MDCETGEPIVLWRAESIKDAFEAVCTRTGKIICTYHSREEVDGVNVSVGDTKENLTAVRIITSKNVIYRRRQTASPSQALPRLWLIANNPDLKRQDPPGTVPLHLV